MTEFFDVEINPIDEMVKEKFSEMENNFKLRDIIFIPNNISF